MKRIAMISMAVVLACALLGVVGCSSSSTSDSTAKIDGMSPGEYRDKAELSRPIPGQTQKGQGRSRKP